MRAIDADSLIGLIKIRKAWHTGYTIDEVIEDIKNSPTLDGYDNGKLTGEWIEVEKPRLGNPYRHYICSRCGNAVPYRVEYCERCGSKNC